MSTDNGTSFDAARPDPHVETGSGSGAVTASMCSLSGALRFLGALLVVAATSIFMLQQWGDGGSTGRYLTLLGMTVSLVAAGVLCGVGVRESRSARTFLALVIAAAPVHFAVLGGLLQSRFPWDGALAENAPWNADSATAALCLAGLGLAVLIPCIRLAMQTLVRPCARVMTRAYLGMNLLLLVPVREPHLVAWLVAASLAFLLLFERHVPAMGHAVRTGEGTYVRSAMLVPAAVVIARTFLWYEPTFAFAGPTLLGGGSACFAWLRTVRGRIPLVTGLQAVSATGAVLGWFLSSVPILDAVPVPVQAEILVMTLPAAALLLLLATRSVSNGAGYRAAAALLAVASSMANMIVFSDPAHVTISGSACLLVGIAFVVVGVQEKRRTPLALGALGVAGGSAHFVVAAIEIESLLHWGTLAAMGALLIFVAALFERHAQRVLAFAGTLGDRMRGWHY